MATKIFDVAEMACEHVQAWVKSCKLENEVSDGAFVALGGLADDTTYTGMKDWNIKEAVAPTSVTTITLDEIGVIDIDAVSNGVIAGNNYRIGNKLVDLKVAAGYPVRYRKMHKGDMFWLGLGNFDVAPTVGKYASLTEGSMILTAADTLPSAEVKFAIRDSKPMTIGASVANSGTFQAPVYEQEYLVEVI